MKSMNLPNLKEAKVRTKNKVDIVNNAYNIPEEVKNIGKNKTYHIITYGCQMNVHDSENISAIMEDLGYTRNETRPEIITMLCGCMAQEEGIANMLKDKYKWVNIVFGTHNIHMIPTYLLNNLKEQTQELEVFSVEGNVYEGIPVKRDSKYTAWVNIMYGCDKFCTYCIVPYTRGKQRSRLNTDIINEVKELVKDGYKEVTLLGQNVNAYGKDLDANYTFANLLEDVAKTNIDRIRFVTSHPWDFTDEMIEVISKYDNIMPYIHLPIQSGSDDILKKMGRKYTIKEYTTLFNKLKSKIPNVSISTDIIVGFPNETEEDFNATLDIVRKLRYDLAYTFIYSKREGTPASKMEDTITLETKKERLAKLNELVNECAKENNMKYLNKEVKVLLTDHSDKLDNLSGYTDTMKLVNVKADDKYLGKIVNVKITDAKTWSLDGVLVDEH